MKYTGKGSNFLMWIPTSGNYVGIGQIMGVGSISQTGEEVDATCIDEGTNFRDYLRGFSDTGECSLELAYDPAKSTHQEVIDVFTNGAERECIIALGTVPPASLRFDAFVRDMNWPELNPSDVMKLNPVLRCTSPISVSVAAFAKYGTAVYNTGVYA